MPSTITELRKQHAEALVAAAFVCYLHRQPSPEETALFVRQLQQKQGDVLLRALSESLQESEEFRLKNRFVADTIKRQQENMTPRQVEIWKMLRQARIAADC